MEASEFGVFRGGNFLQTLSRGLRVLEVLGDVARPLQPNEIAEALGVPRPAAYRLLTTLRAHKMVTPAPGGGYVLGYGIITLARQVDRDFRHQIRRLLPRLSNELSATISVGVEEGDDLVCIAAAEPSGPGTHVRWMEGLRHP